eukprot:scaffold49388_cov28-Tisochrysis_lutea.AAC.3
MLSPLAWRCKKALERNKQRSLPDGEYQVPPKDARPRTHHGRKRAEAGFWPILANGLARRGLLPRRGDGQLLTSSACCRAVCQGMGDDRRN